MRDARGAGLGCGQPAHISDSSQARIAESIRACVARFLHRARRAEVWFRANLRAESVHGHRDTAGSLAAKPRRRIGRRRSARTTTSARISSASGSGRTGLFGGAVRGRRRPRRGADAQARPSHRRGGSAGAARVLDVGCGWGALLRRLVEHAGVSEAVGLTLSASQAAWVREHSGPGIEVREESWRDHKPEAPYDAIISIGAFEHFARPGLSPEEKLAAYREFFDFCRGALKDGGRLSLQTIAYVGSDVAMPQFFAEEIFPETEPPLHLGADCRGRRDLRAGRAPQRPRALRADAPPLAADAYRAPRGGSGARRRGGRRPFPSLPEGLGDGVPHGLHLPPADELRQALVTGRWMPGTCVTATVVTVVTVFALVLAWVERATRKR